MWKLSHDTFWRKLGLLQSMKERGLQGWEHEGMYSGLEGYQVNAEGDKDLYFARSSKDALLRENRLSGCHMTALLSGWPSERTTMELSSMLSNKNKRGRNTSALCHSVYWREVLAPQQRNFQCHGKRLYTYFQVFTPKGHGWVTLYSRSENSHVFEELLDTGPGMNP